MALNVKVGLIGPLDMLKFKNMSKVREETIQKAPAKEISGEFIINTKAKELHPDVQELEITEIIDHAAAGAKTFVFKPSKGRIAYFRAGQYLSIKEQIGSSFVTRPYSISSSPKDTKNGKISITVKANPTGYAAEHFLNDWKVGTKVLASDPQGQFYYEPMRDGKTVVACAGGSGITPFLSMAEAIRDGVEDFNLIILFGSRNRESILFAKEFEDISKATDKVKVVHVLSDEEAEGYEHGFINAELIKKYAPASDYSVFICGPEAMYRFIEKELPALGLPNKNIRRELLGVTKKVWEQVGYPSECKDKTFKITVKRGPEESVIDASANESVLVALEKAGIKAPSRCRSGECGWCRSKLVSGSVFIPEENEGRRFSDIEFNYIHPCASFATSDLVIEVAGEYY